MTLQPDWLVWLPLAGMVAAFLVPVRARAIGLAASLLTLAAVAAVAGRVLAGESIDSTLGGYAAPLGIELYVDGLAAWMLLLTALVGVSVCVYAANDPPSAGGDAPSFWRLWLLLWSGMNALYVSRDLFNLYVTLEIVSVAAVSTVLLAGGARAVRAALRYLLLAIFGSLAFLAGVVLVYAEHGVLSLGLLADAIQASPAAALALVLLTLGLLVKTAVFPFHVWLPEAHGSAPAVVSALLSGLVVKASFYVVVRLWVFVFGGVPLTAAAQIVAVLGVAALAYGSVQALRQRSLKLLVAYSTVAQLGYLCLAMPLVVGAEPAAQALAYRALAFHLVTHALAKAALFLSAGSILHAFGTDTIGALRGFARRMPITASAFGLAGASLVGLPPSGGFVAKWWLAGASLADARAWLVAVVVLGGLLTATYLFRVLAVALLEPMSLREQRATSAPLAVVTFALALAAALLGLWADELGMLLEPGLPFGGGS